MRRLLLIPDQQGVGTLGLYEGAKCFDASLAGGEFGQGEPAGESIQAVLHCGHMFQRQRPQGIGLRRVARNTLPLDIAIPKVIERRTIAELNRSTIPDGRLVQVPRRPDALIVEYT